MKDLMVSDSYRPAVDFLKQKYEAHRKAVDEVVIMANQRNAADEKDAANIIESRTIWLVALGTVMVLVTALLAWLIGRQLLAGVQRTVQALEQVAQGDLTVSVEVSTTDEIGRMLQALNQTVTSMREALAAVEGLSTGTATASRQMAFACEQLSSGAQEQASSLEETSASLEEITSSVKQNADNAKQANQLALGSRGIAESGGEVARQAIVAMNEITKSSQRITDIISAIDEIAFQTNLLALNAAVEAARAGEQGRGFAVVAAEVRNLAQRAATAAKEIKGLIHDSVKKIEGGSQLVNRSGQSLEEIVTSVKRVTDIMAEIAASSQEQFGGIEQVNRAVSQMDTVVQQNAAQAEELTATARSLADQAQALITTMERFKLGERKAARPAARRPLGDAAALVPQPLPAESGNRLRRAEMAAHSSAVAEHNGFEEF